MIHSLRITDPNRITPTWTKHVPALIGRTFEFSSGLNILWGRNGSGKSTLLSILAIWLHAKQGGWSTVTESSVSRIVQRSLDRGEEFFDGAELRHDGKPISYLDPDHKTGLIGSAFDDDFFAQGVANTMYQGSSGQRTIRDISLAAKASGHGIEYRIRKDTVNDLWKARIELAERMLAPSGPSGPYTAVLDEPDRSLDIDNAAVLWKSIISGAERRQFIVATHSMFALGIRGASYIELSPGYLEKCLEALLALSHD